jgi:hypothetical protein
MTAAEPTISYRAKKPEGANLAEMMNLAVANTWDANYGQRQYRDTVKATVVYGTWFWKIEHDPGYGGRGTKVGFRQVPCFRIFPAPYATDPESSPVMIEVQPRTVEEIYNDYGIRVQPELEPADFADIAEDLSNPKDGPTWEAHLGAEGSGGATSASWFLPSSFAMGRGKSQGFVFQKEMWFRDSAMERKYRIDRTAKGPEAKYEEDLMFPHGRLVGWANGQLLYDDESPYLDGRWPYVRYADNLFPGVFWGMGEIPNIVNLQLLHDDTVDSMRLIHAYMANPRTIIDKTTGLSDGEIGNDPDEIWWTNRGTHDRIKVHHGATPPAEFYTHVRTIEQWADLMTGSPEVGRGENPPGVRAGKAIQALQRAGSTRTRGRLKELEETLKIAGQLLLSRHQQFSPEKVTLQSGRTGFKEFWLSEEERLMELSVAVDIISSLDDVRAAEFQKTLLLFNLKLVSAERLIKESGMASAQTILAELPALQEKQMEAVMQQMQMAEAQAQAGAEPGEDEEQGPVRSAAQDVVGTRRDVTRATSGG